MIDKKMVYKLYKIFKYFIDRDAKIWNIDTNVYNTWSRFIKNINDKFLFDNFNFTKLDIIPIPHHNVNNKVNEYLVQINGNDLTPNITKKPWSWAGVRQFLQEGSFFGIIIFNNVGAFKNSEKLPISPKLALMLTKKFDWGELILNSIKNSMFSDAKDIKNFGLSCLFAYVVKHHYILFEQMDKIIQFQWIKIKKGNVPFHSKDEKCKINGDKIYKETYKDLIEQLINKYALEDIVFFLYSKISDESEFFEELNQKSLYDIKYEENQNFLKKRKEYFIKLSSERGKLRNIIINNRVNNKGIYSDIQLTNEPHIQDTEAAHIYEIYSIKKEIEQTLKQNIYTYENIMNNLIEQASNENNGLLMPSHVHKMYDRDIFQFDIEGKIIFQEENLDRIKSLRLGLENSKIKESVLNDEMVNFLKKRIT